MADFPSNISAAIRRRRSELGLTLDEVATRVGTSKSHIWSIEQGRSVNPTLAMAIALCDALSISLNELVGMDVSQPIYSEQEMAMIAAHRAIFGGGNG